MVEYESIKSEFIDYGVNKFIEVSRKKVLPDEAEFINISKGYYTHEGERRYQGGIGFPVDEELVKTLVEKLGEVSKQ
ncbi:MAG TPA: hypothetical protein ENN13_03815 [Candidatus Altiarchaeales archaeon]|nr:hypothetical protein [Candidatus Altiarchaeales archaeon]